MGALGQSSRPGGASLLWAGLTPGQCAVSGLLQYPSVLPAAAPTRARPTPTWAGLTGLAAHDWRKGCEGPPLPPGLLGAHPWGGAVCKPSAHRSQDKDKSRAQSLLHSTGKRARGAGTGVAVVARGWGRGLAPPAGVRGGGRRGARGWAGPCGCCWWSGSGARSDAGEGLRRGLGPPCPLWSQTRGCVPWGGGTGPAPCVCQSGHTGGAAQRPHLSPGSALRFGQGCGVGGAGLPRAGRRGLTPGSPPQGP